MNVSFYPKLALDGIRKNKRLYVPYFLTCAGMAAMHYIVSFLQYTKSLDSAPGAETIRLCMMLGSRVIAIFACLFLFYTNSFLMKRRKKEFGLYSVLGMNRKNISHVLFFETLFTATGSILFGTLIGILFSKLAEVSLVKVIGGDVTYDLSVSYQSILITVISFAVVFLLLLLNNIRQIRFANTVSLLNSENKGEKVPKANWFLGIAGLIILAVAYYLAITIEEPLSAMTVFFGDVIAVIIATYLLFIAGSVLVCKLLQSNKKYYYSGKHFVSVSSMAYRMKRNGAGLASICILSTMVLVMISSSASLYTGTEDALVERYPKDINLSFNFVSPDALSNENIDSLVDFINGKTTAAGCSVVNALESRTITVYGYLADDGSFIHDPTKGGGYSSDMIFSGETFCSVGIVPISDYNKTSAEKIELNDGEAAIAAYRTDFAAKKITFLNGYSLNIKTSVAEYDADGETSMDMIPSVTLYVNDIGAVAENVGILNREDSKTNAACTLSYAFDTDSPAADQIALADGFVEILPSDELKAQFAYYRCTAESREGNRADFYGTYGSLFVIGILLSIVFIAAAVLIMYYKQITEGYEDASRFSIMKKVGMTDREIKKSINSQLLTVFSLPLLAAGMHLGFAFPIISRILKMFNLYNVSLFARTTVTSFVLFAILYAVVYKITSNSYFKIVSGAKADYRP